MQHLIELVNLVQKTKFKANGLLELIIEPDSRIDRLYEAIWHKKIQSDADVKTVLSRMVR